MEGCLLRLCPPAAAAARSKEACDWPTSGMFTLPAWAEVDAPVAVLLGACEVAGVLGMLLALSELDDRCRREGVGCVAPVSWCVGFGSEISTGRSDADVEVEECDALLATEAD